MPSTSKKQAKFMAAAAHNPAFAKKAGIDVGVAKEFNKADTGTRADLQKVAKPKTDHGKSKLFKKGGHMKPVDMKKNPGVAKLPTAVRNKMGFMKDGGAAHSDIKMDKKVVKKAVGMHDKQQHGGKKTDLAALRKGGMATKKMAKGGGIESKGKTKGTMITMRSGGKACK
jgi:hypothetical protein